MLMGPQAPIREVQHQTEPVYITHNCPYLNVLLLFDPPPRSTFGSPSLALWDQLFLSNPPVIGAAVSGPLITTPSEWRRASVAPAEFRSRSFRTPWHWGFCSLFVCVLHSS